jgi:transposase
MALTVDEESSGLLSGGPPMYRKGTYRLHQGGPLSLDEESVMTGRNYILGADVSKSSLQLCLMKREPERVVRRYTIPNDSRDIRLFLKSLSSEYSSSLCVAAEPTGPYWYPLADTALSMGHKVVSAPTRAARSFLQSISERAKNDRIDAKGIARYACLMELRDYTPKTKEIRSLETLLAMRKKLSLTVSEFTQSKDSLVEVSDILEETLRTLKKQIKELDARILKAQNGFDASDRLRGVPGIGPVVAGALLTKLIQNDFVSSDAFVAYIGLDVKVRESGKYKGKRMLSHRGDAEIRRLLYLGAQASIRVKGSPFSRIYQAHRDRGLSTTESLCAVARKLARTAWSIVRYNTQYDPDRVSKDLRAEQKNLCSTNPCP